VHLRIRSARQEYGMSLTSSADGAFLKTLEVWLGSEIEVLVLIRYSRAAGDKSFEFYKSFAALKERLSQLPAEACITVFRNRQLPLRGIVDDEFIRKCLSTLQDGSEFAVVETAQTTAGPHSWFDFSTGTSHEELREDLESRRGKPVAAGEYPPWLEDSSDVISAYVPGQEGEARRGVY
jgi:hypothetical protein